MSGSAAELLPPAPDPVPSDPGPTPAAKLKCEFCQCQLSPSGDYLKLSDRAKELRQLEERIETVKRDLAAAAEALTTVTRERDTARAEAAANKKPRLW